MSLTALIAYTSSWCRSVIPPSATDRKRWQDSFILQVVNDSPIATYGNRLLTINIGLQQLFIRFPLLQMSNSPALTFSSTKSYHYSHFTQPHSAAQKPQERIGGFVRSFSRSSIATTKEQPVKRSVTHHITITGPSVSTCFCRLL